MNRHRQGRKLDHALVQRIERLQNSGTPKRAIARQLGVSYNTVQKYTRRNPVPSPLKQPS